MLKERDITEARMKEEYKAMLERASEIYQKEKAISEEKVDKLN